MLGVDSIGTASIATPADEQPAPMPVNDERALADASAEVVTVVQIEALEIASAMVFV